MFGEGVQKTEGIRTELDTARLSRGWQPLSPAVARFLLGQAASGTPLSWVRL